MNYLPKILVLGLLLAMISACAGPDKVSKVSYPDKQELQPPPRGPIVAEPYRISTGDVISVKLLNNPELNTDVTVRPDGKISMPLVGDVPAWGLTIEEVRALISKGLKNTIAKNDYGYVLKEGDYIDIRFVYQPELNIGVRIFADGSISLPMIGEIKAAGLRPKDLNQRLVIAYAKVLKKPDVTVIVGQNTNRKIFAEETFIGLTLAKSASQQVFVGGEVLHPKSVNIGARLTVLQAIQEAMGVKDSGDLSRVIILRRGQFNQGQWIQTNLISPIIGKSMTNDVVLQGGDVVIVPKSGIAKVNQFVKEWLRDTMPTQTSFTSYIDLTTGVGLTPSNTGP